MILLAFIYATLIVTSTLGESYCGVDWTAYKDEKCIKVFHDMLSYEDATKACHLAAKDASIITIRSAEEQKFIANLLFQKHKVHDPNWLGAKFDNEVR